MKFLLRLAILAGTIFLISYLFPGLIKVDSPLTALIVALVLAIINALIRPVVLVLTFPINILTLGLFTFIINGLMLILVSSIVPGFTISSFWAAVLASIFISIVNAFVSSRIVDEQQEDN